MRQLSSFRVVFLVMGNHEPWHSTWDDTKQTIHQIEIEIQQEREKKGGIGEFVVLDRTCYELRGVSGENITILGCTLFSKVPAESMEMVSFGVNDFYHTADWTVENHNAEFERDLGWLNEKVTSLKDSGQKVVILTHHSPTLDERATDPKHLKSPIQSGFATDLGSEPCWLSDIVKVWAFGHTHFNCDFEDEKTGKRVIANQRGYYFSQSTGFVDNKVIVI
ncbi:Ser/Thr protein phosphatase superfamily [Annulohypoxylon bovei var. microspora]|nr:Ser/Thr protein phosphatase superfamily [Annulohypoxylon bovei var. microspora]